MQKDMETLTETKPKLNSDKSSITTGSLFKKASSKKQNHSISQAQQTDFDQWQNKQGSTSTIYSKNEQQQFLAQKCRQHELGITKCQPRENKGGKTTRTLGIKRPKRKELEDIENQKNHGIAQNNTTKENHKEINMVSNPNTRQAFNEVNGNNGRIINNDFKRSDLSKRYKEMHQSVEMSIIQETLVSQTRQQVLEQTLKTLEICAQTERALFSSQFNSKAEQPKNPISSLTETNIHRRGKSKDATVIKAMESQNKDLPSSNPSGILFQHPKLKDYYRSSSTVDLKPSKDIAKTYRKTDRLTEIKEAKTPTCISISASRSQTPISKSNKNLARNFIPSKVKHLQPISQSTIINQPLNASKVGVPKTQKPKKVNKLSKATQPLSQCKMMKTPFEKQTTHNSKVDPHSDSIVEKQYETLPKQIVETKPDSKERKRENAIRIIKERLLAVIKGFKVRRIMKNHKQVLQLKQELIDLNKFVSILNCEVKDSVKSHSSNGFNHAQSLQQTRLLLVRTTKDLFSKRLLFHQTFYDAYKNPAWMKLSRKVIKPAINSQIHRYNTERRNEKMSKQLDQHLPQKMTSISQISTRMSKNLNVARRGSASNLCESTVSGRNASMKGLVNLHSTQQVQLGTKCTEIQEDIEFKDQMKVTKNISVKSQSNEQQQTSKANNNDMIPIKLPSASDLIIQRVQEKVTEDKRSSQVQSSTLQKIIAVQDSKIQEARKARKKLKSSRDLRRSVDFRTKVGIESTQDQLDKSQTISTNEPLLIDLSIPIEVPLKEESKVCKMPIKQMASDTTSFLEQQTAEFLKVRASNNSNCPTVSQQILQNFQNDMDRSRVSQEFPFINTTNQTIDAVQYPILDTSQNISNLRNSTNQFNMLTSRTNSSANQMEQIIEDLKHTASSIESSQKQIKTMETLNAIRGMIESLKNNNILSPIEEVEKPQRQNIYGEAKHRRQRSAELQRFKTNQNVNQQKAKAVNELELKKKFEELVTNLQCEFNNLLESRQQAVKEGNYKTYQRSKSTNKLGKKT